MAGPSWDDVAQDGDFAFLPARMTSVRGEEVIRRAFPDQEDKSDVVLVVARAGAGCNPPTGPLPINWRGSSPRRIRTRRG